MGQVVTTEVHARAHMLAHTPTQVPQAPEEQTQHIQSLAPCGCLALEEREGDSGSWEGPCEGPFTPIKHLHSVAPHYCKEGHTFPPGCRRMHVGPGPDLSLFRGCKASKEPGKMDLYSWLMDTPLASGDTWSPGEGMGAVSGPGEPVCHSTYPLSWAWMTLARA